MGAAVAQPRRQSHVVWHHLDGLAAAETQQGRSNVLGHRTVALPGTLIARHAKDCTVEGLVAAMDNGHAQPPEQDLDVPVQAQG